jgi:hypothetical protein
MSERELLSASLSALTERSGELAGGRKRLHWEAAFEVASGLEGSLCRQRPIAT